MEERMPYSTVSDNLADINELFDIPANKLTNVGQVLKAMTDRDHTPLEIRTDPNGHEVNAYPAAIWQEFWEKVANRDLPQKLLAMLRPEAKSVDGEQQPSNNQTSSRVDIYVSPLSIQRVNIPQEIGGGQVRHLACSGSAPHSRLDTWQQIDAVEDCELATTIRFTSANKKNICPAG